MKHAWRFWMFGGVAAALIAFPFAAFANAVSSPYTEVGDAGGLLDPQPLGPAGVGYNGIIGTIGDTDLVDAFAFFFAGGHFHAQALTDPALPSLFLSLWPPTPITPQDPIVPPMLNSFDVTLPAGNYILQIATSAADPPYEIIFTDGAPGVFITAPRLVPEPATLALFGLGLAGWTATRRRKRPAAPAR